MQAMFKIEKGIPVPPTMVNRAKYPFRQMEVGDSFFVASEAGDAAEKAVRTRAYALSGKGRKFSVSRVAGGVRVWRTA